MGLPPNSRFSCYPRTPMPATDEILPQSTPQDTHSLRRILKFGAGSRRGHLLRILGVGFGLAVGIGNTIGTGILRTPGERLQAAAVHVIGMERSWMGGR